MKHHKDEALDSIISNHPLVKELKLEAKKYKKAQLEISLMQAQTHVARKKGFNNWHDFLQKIKLLFNSEFKYNFLLSAEKGMVPKGAILHLGRSKTYGLEQWINSNILTTHISVFEAKPSIHSMDVYLAEQMIKNNKSLIFVSENVEETEHLAAFTMNKAQDEHLYIIDYTNSLSYQYNDYLSCYNPLQYYSSENMVELIFSIMSIDDVDDNFIKGRTITLLSSFIGSLVYIKAQQKEVITWSDLLVDMREYLLNNIDNLPEHIKKDIDNYMDNSKNSFYNTIQNKYFTTIEKYQKLIIDNLKFFDIVKLQEKDIRYTALILLPKRKEIKKEIYYDEKYFKMYDLFLSYLKSSINQCLFFGSEITSNYADIVEKQVTKKTTLMIMRDPILIQNLVMPAKARALKIALLFSYSERYDKHTQKEGFKAMMANTTLKIFNENIKNYSFLQSMYEQELNRIAQMNGGKLLSMDKLKEHEYILSYKSNIQTIKVIKMSE